MRVALRVIIANIEEALILSIMRLRHFTLEIHIQDDLRVSVK